MNKKILSLFMFFVSININAQYPGYTQVDDLTKFKSDIFLASQKITSIKCDFVQDKNLSMLSEKITSKGKFWFKKESQVRMEYNKPFQYLVVINKDKVLIKDNQKENIITTKSNKIFQQINKIMIDCFQGTSFNNSDFTARIFENKKNSLIELTPVTVAFTKIFKSINIIIEKNDFSVSSIEMKELSGDNTFLLFINKEINIVLSDTLFYIK
ncbi:MAG: outer membrane lipoprotein carrier protein LolA [Bacteroidetes bacterium]|nr:outer membrane lipoprotein carrier protein LolA [Bacteroidota bacterium]